VYQCINTHVSLSFSISPASDVPIFRQIVQQIQRAVAVKRLRVGEQLPAVRTLAEELVINPNTVARSYQELIREGILESRSGRGVFVAEWRQVFSHEERLRRLLHAAEQLCHQAILVGSGLPEIRAVLDAKWDELQRSTRTVNTSEERKKK
jgi:GntR family transcriptional regulator